jgi:hypothetical protein
VTTTVENPWWGEGWRLLRERLPEMIPPRRRRILALVVGLSVVAAAVGGWALVRAIDDDEPVSGVGQVAMVLLVVLLAVQLSFSVCVLVWARRDREPDFRAGRVSLGLEPVFDLKRPLPALSEDLRAEARVHIERMRRSLPASILGMGAFQLFPPVALVLMAVSGLWSANAWLLLALLLLNGWQPFYFLKLLGSTTAQLRRLDEATIVEPPTFRGPRAWGIEAPRNPPEIDSTAG